jgi:rSAM/selenodomain-associated transferase 2
MNISIIIPALNESLNIVRAVQQAKALGPKEVIVVDGGSDDDTVQLARTAGAIVLQSRRGRGMQQNVGAAHAQGDVLLFLHADCWLAPGALVQIESALANDQALAGAFQHRIDSPGILFRLIERGDTLRVRWFKLPYGDQGIFVRRHAFQQLGGFPDVRLMEDVLFMRQMRKCSPILLLPGPLFTSARRWRQMGIIRQTLRNWAILAAEKAGVPPDRLAKFYRVSR